MKKIHDINLRIFALTNGELLDMVYYNSKSLSQESYDEHMLEVKRRGFDTIQAFRYYNQPTYFGRFQNQTKYLEHLISKAFKQNLTIIHFLEVFNHNATLSSLDGSKGFVMCERFENVFGSNITEFERSLTHDEKELWHGYFQ